MKTKYRFNKREGHVWVAVFFGENAQSHCGRLIFTEELFAQFRKHQESIDGVEFIDEKSPKAEEKS